MDDMNVNPLTDMNKPDTEWQKLLSEREILEIHLAIVYASHFHHGTTGHNQLMIIAKLAEMISRAEVAGTDFSALQDKGF